MVTLMEASINARATVKAPKWILMARMSNLLSRLKCGFHGSSFVKSLK
jgi:hypothetical protein